MEPTINERLLEKRFEALEAAHTWHPRVISRIESHIRTSEDKGLFRMNPIRYAEDRGMSEGESIDLFLHGTALGLFQMDWLLLCPMCACVVESLASLKSVGNRFHCGMCHSDYEARLDDYIAVTFTIAPDIRKIMYHTPAEMPAERYCFEYKMTSDGHVENGPPLVELMKSVSHGVTYIEAGKTHRFDVDSPSGTYFGWDIDTGAYFDFHIAGAAEPEPRVIAVRHTEGSCEPHELTLAPGKITFEVTNTSDRRCVFALCTIPENVSKAMLTYAPFLNGGRLLTTQTFRDLFRSELVKSSEGIGVRDVTLLFTDLKGSTALYDRIGDLNAFSLVQQHFERLLDVTVTHSGAVIKTLGDAVMATFRTPVDAVRAAIEMREEIERFNHLRPGEDLILKIGVHHGPAIAVTLNERLDYFGQTVNIAARVQGVARANEICFTRDVHSAPGVAEVLAPYSVEQDYARLRGVDEEVLVFRVSQAQMAASPA
ncbi:Adenylate cyclase [Pararobbsia alpina]|uniref:adenylate/guanylate cyclase domain-containing protein n=1 Tax=Pararobbsia alpina TaxID=621374 RepID=UPI0039A674FE